MTAASSSLLTDFYQLTMLSSYFRHGVTAPAVFELFVRRLPPARNFVLAAGLEQALEFLEGLRFTLDELDWVARSGRFDAEFVEHLATLRFTGEVHALAEGTVCFPEEPILRVTAPLPEAQLVESRLINLIHFQTLIASKAARAVLVAPGKLLVDFGFRRAHGGEAGLLAARAAHLAGMTGTATALAAMRFGVPVFGTMAHSFVQAHDDEAEAFARFAREQRGPIVLLLDTYDTETAAAMVVQLARRLRTEGVRIDGVRIDSGDLAEHARRVRGLLDAGGLGDLTIFASGDLDEYRVRDLLAAGAPIDGFGLGSRLDTAADVPYLDCVYKLQEYAGRPRRKRSEGKATWPGRKQIYRRYGDHGRMAGDVLTLEDDRQDGEPLLRLVMRAGRRTGPASTLGEARARAAAELRALPDSLRTLDPAPPYPVEISPALHALTRGADAAKM